MKKTIIALVLLMMTFGAFASGPQATDPTASKDYVQEKVELEETNTDPYYWIVIPTVDVTPPKIEVPDSEYYDEKEKEFNGFMDNLMKKVEQIFSYAEEK